MRRAVVQLRLNMPAPVRYKGISISDKDRKKHEGVTPHKATWHAPSQLFFVATSRRMPFMHHLPPVEDAQEDPHAAFAYKLAEEVARAQRGEVRYQIRGVSRDTLATVCEVKMKPLETILSLETVCISTPLRARRSSQCRALHTHDRAVAWIGRIAPHVAARVQVKLSVPASGDAGPSTAVFVAAGVGCLVTEDWSSQGAVHLFSVAKQQTQTPEGASLEQWQLTPEYRRELAGPVTAISASDGRLVVAYGHNVRPQPVPLECERLLFPRGGCVRCRAAGAARADAVQQALCAWVTRMRSAHCLQQTMATSAWGEWGQGAAWNTSDTG